MIVDNTGSYLINFCIKVYEMWQDRALTHLECVSVNVTSYVNTRIICTLSDEGAAFLFLSLYVCSRSSPICFDFPPL